MSQYIVIGTAPCNDVTVAVGPFRSSAKADEAWDQLTYLGYNAETCELLALSDLEPAQAYDENDE